MSFKAWDLSILLFVLLEIIKINQQTPETSWTWGKVSLKFWNGYWEMVYMSFMPCQLGMKFGWVCVMVVTEIQWYRCLLWKKDRNKDWVKHKICWNIVENETSKKWHHSTILWGCAIIQLVVCRECLVLIKQKNPLDEVESQCRK